MSCVRFAALAITGLIVSPVFGAPYYWFGGEGTVTDPTKYHYGNAPSDPADSLLVNNKNESGAEGWEPVASRILFPTSFQLSAVNLDTPAEPASPDPCATVFEGTDADSTLYLDRGSQITIGTGRELTVRNLKIVRDNHATQKVGMAIKNSGKLTFGEGSSFATETAAEYVFLPGGAVLKIDGGDVSLASLTMQTDENGTGLLDVRSGRLTLGGGYGDTLTKNANVRFTGGDIVIQTGLGTPRYLPKGKDTTLTVNNNGITAVDFREGVVAEGERLAWRGTVNVTNGNGTAFIPDFNGTIYGGGTLRVGSVFQIRPVTQDVQLAEIALTKGIYVNTTEGVSEFRFRGDTAFVPWNGAMSWALHSGAYRAVLFGKTTFATVDGASGVTRNMSPLNLVSSYRSSLAVTGPGTVTVRYDGGNSGVGTTSDRLASFSQDPGSTFMLELAPYRGRFRMQDLKLGAGATYKLSSYLSGEEIPEVVGKVEADATSQFVSLNTPTYITTAPVARFISLDDTATLPQVADPADLPETHSVQRIGGCVFIAPKDGVAVTSGGAGTWSGNGTTGKWSEDANWVSGRPNWYFHVSLGGTRNLYSENDITEEAYRGYASVGVAASAGPFHVSGVAIPLGQEYNNSADSGAVNTASAFPVFFELPLSSVKTTFAAIVKSDKGMIVFRDSVSVPNGDFIPCGSVVVEGNGAVAAKGLRFGPGFYRPTILTVQKGGTVTASAQETVNDAAASLWIAKSGTVDIAGDWKWNSNSNEHQIDGALNVSGNLGGDAAQSYFGEGVVKIGGTSDETTAVRIGEGVTLAPAGWGQMKLDVVSSAKVGAQADWTYAAASFDVSGLDAEVTFVGDRTITVDAPFVGHDFKVAKEGMGTLVLASGVGTSLASRAVSVEAGTLAWTDDTAVGELKVESGATLAFGTKANGEVAALSLGANVDLDGVTVKPLDADAQTAIDAGAVTVLTVPFGCTISGTPTVPEGIRLRTVVNADESMSLKAKTIKGFSVIIR